MTIRLNVDISEELNARLDELAAQSGNTKSGLMRKAIALIDLAVTEKERGNHLSIINSQKQVLMEIIGV